MHGVLLLQFVDLRLKLKFVTFLCRDLLLLKVLQVELLLLIVEGVRIPIVKELNLQGLIQVVLASGLCRYRAVTSARLFVDLLNLFLLLHFLSAALELRPTIHASSNHRGVVRNGLVLSHVLLMYQVISSRYGIVTVGLDAFYRVLILEFVLILHDLEDLIVKGHFFLPREEATDAFFFRNLEPRVRTNVFNRVTRVWVCVQDLSQQVGTFC